MATFKTAAQHRADIRANQRRGVANTLRAGNKLTAAQKKNFTAKEIASIRSGLKPASPSKAISLAAGRASLRGRKRSGLTGVKGAGTGLGGRRRGTKAIRNLGAGGASVRKERALRKRRKSKPRYTGKKETRGA